MPAGAGGRAVSRVVLVRLLLGLVGLVLLAGVAYRVADPAAPPPSAHHGSQATRQHPPEDQGWSLLAAPVGVAVTFALASGVFWLARRRHGGAG